jgi:glycosyl transferase family WbsX
MKTLKLILRILQSLHHSGLKRKHGLSRGGYRKITGENMMSKKLSSCLICLILLCTLVGTVNARALVGAIRWDDWSDKDDYPYSTWSRYLEPEQWHYRHPFFSKLYLGKLEMRCDNQEATDQEIAYAKEAGLDYWAYGYYWPGSWPMADRYNYALYQYLASAHKSDVKFCIRLGGDSGNIAGWQNQVIPSLISWFKEPSYQTVAGGRPLVYMFGCDDFTTRSGGSDATAEAALDALRTAAVNAGCGSPYIVCMVWSGTEGKNYIDNQGYNAMSAYTATASGNDQEYPYSTLTAASVNFWNSCKSTGKQVIPIVNIGWDNRPGRADGYRAPGPWYTEPTMNQWKNHLQAALNWVDVNPSAAEPNAVIIYAWNEFEEGGWMTPTRGEGTARIDATGEVLNP